jgi:hypothetical protein
LILTSMAYLLLFLMALGAVYLIAVLVAIMWELWRRGNR